MGISPGMVAFRLAYQVSPILLQGGVVSFMQGGLVPLVAFTQGIDLTFGLLSGANVDIDDWWANFQPLPGSTLISQKIGMYPFANQAVAANATIAEPLNVSMLMLVPANNDGGYVTKLAVMSALQATLAAHNSSGGTYVIATPSFWYTNALMTMLTDVTEAVSKQAQVAWKFDFVQPLLTLQQAQSVQNSLMSKITNGIQINGQTPSLFAAPSTVGIPPSGAGQAVSGITSNTPGSFASNSTYPAVEL